MDIVQTGNPLIVTEEDALNLDRLVSSYLNHQRGFGSIIRSAAYSDLYEWLISKTPCLNGEKKYSIMTRLYWVAHGLVDFPVCAFCGVNRLEKDVDSFERGYFRACSVRCPGMLEEKFRKVRATCFEKWGVENFFASEEGKKLRADWCAEHGVDNPFQLEEVKEKSRQTRKERFGFEYTMQSEEKRQMTSERYKEKTGFATPFENPDVTDKALKRKREKKAAGIDDYAKNRRMNRLARYNKFLENKEIRPVFQESDFAALDAKTQYTTLLRWKCEKCGSEFDAYLDQNFSSRYGLPVRCEKCHPFAQDGVSEEERQLIGFVKSLCPDAVGNDRSVISPYELDVYVPSRKLAFEFDGLYWHSDAAGKSANYHLMKTEACMKAGVRLVHVFEDEWREKRIVTEDWIRRVLDDVDYFKQLPCTAFAKINTDEALSFVSANSLFPQTKSFVSFGAYSKSELVSAMTFTKVHGIDKNWTITGMCDKVGVLVPPETISGIISAFEREYKPSKLFMKADRRWSDGEIFLKNGFSFVKTTRPAPFFCKNVKRFGHRKPNGDGFFRIFDCGNMVFEKTYP